MKKILGSIIALFVVVVAAGCASVSAQEAYVTVDINPSVAFVVSGKEKVVSVYPLNEDGEAVLLDLELIGLGLESAMDLYIAKAIELGYINESDAETEVQVEVVAATEKLRARIRERIQEKMQKAFQVRSMVANINSKVFTEDFIAEATNEGLTPAKYMLIKKAMLTDEALTLEAAKQLTNKELLGYIHQYANAWGEYISEVRAEAKIARDEIRADYLPQIVAIRVDIAAAILANEDTTALEAELVALLTAMHAEIRTAVESCRRNHDHIGGFN